jgi:N-dimethylarginine dimethylaminohydrolase
MCPPEYFDVRYSINPWMDPSKPVDTGLAMAQWERLRETYLALGHHVEVIDPVPGLPDMVFAANGATAIGNRALIARFRHPERAADVPGLVRGQRLRGERRAALRQRGPGRLPG